MSDKKLPTDILAIPKKEFRVGRTSRNRIHTIQAVLNSSMNVGLHGLKQKIERLGIRVSDIPRGQCILFVQRKRKKIKLIMGTGDDYPVMVSYEYPPNQSFHEHSVQYIARAFNAPGRVDNNERLKLGINRFYQRHGQKPMKDVTSYEKSS